MLKIPTNLEGAVEGAGPGWSADISIFPAVLFLTHNPYHIIIFSLTMTIVPPPAKVLVTGANGYIAIWVVRLLLEQGYSVRGTVRSAEKGKYLTEYFGKLGFGDKLEIVVVEDITKVICLANVISVQLISYGNRKAHSIKLCKALMLLNTRRLRL